VLNRIGKVLDSLFSWAETDGERERIRCIQESLEKVKEGKLAVTLVIEDLSGNSAIIADTAKVCRIEVIEDDLDGQS
jgi:C4-type Zn-finger protein